MAIESKQKPDRKGKVGVTIDSQGRLQDDKCGGLLDNRGGGVYLCQGCGEVYSYADIAWPAKSVLPSVGP